MRFYTTKPLRLLFPSVLWTGPSDAVYLTFDDGPHPITTPAVLDVLRSFQVKATFFLIGQNVMRHQDIAAQILEDGHAVGNHSFHHPLMVFRSQSFLADQIDRTQEQIYEATRTVSRYFRPPYGYFGPSLVRTSLEHKHHVVMWDIDSGDHELTRPETVATRTARGTRESSIVLFHDNELTSTRSVDLLARYLDAIFKRSLTFSALP